MRGIRLHVLPPNVLLTKWMISTIVQQFCQRHVWAMPGVAIIESAGLLPGMFCDAHQNSRQFELERGDCLLMYTDGVVEATDKDDCGWGLPAHPFGAECNVS